MAEEVEIKKKGLQQQYDSLTQRHKELEERVSAGQREKTAGLMEKQLLKDSLAQKEHQCQVEAQVWLSPFVFLY